MITIPEGFVETDPVMTNFDHSIEPQAETRLQNELVFGQYAGWDFCGKVWWDRNQQKWACEVWVHRRVLSL